MSESQVENKPITCAVQPGDFFEEKVEIEAVQEPVQEPETVPEKVPEQVPEDAPNQPETVEIVEPKKEPEEVMRSCKLSDFIYNQNSISFSSA